MSTTLSLSECMLSMGLELKEQGRNRDAIKLFSRLLRFRDLPTEIVEQAQTQISELLLAERQYRKARRHLAVLMCLKPRRAKPYFQYAVALHRDSKCDPHRAAKYYQRALDMDPTQARWWSAYGKLLLEIGRTPEAVAVLKHASELDEHDPAIIGRYVEALCLDGRADEAETVMRTERFRHPNDPRFRKIWNDFRFRQIANSQSAELDEEPVLLAFVKKALLPNGDPGPREIYRLDDGQPTVTPPHSMRKSRSRSAQ